MSCISHINLCPSSGDNSNVLLQKILQSLNAGGGGGGAGVSSISINGGAPQTGAVSISTGGTITSVNGDPGPAVLLDSGEIPEGANLYFTNARAIASTLTGFVAAAGTITALDSILTAVEKLDFRTSGSNGPWVLKAGDTMTGGLTFSLSANIVPITVSAYSVDAANTTPAIFVSGTWNTTGAPTALLVDIANTASSTNSLLFDFKFAGASLMKLRRDGLVTLAGRINAVATTGVAGTFAALDTGTASAPTVLNLQHALSAGTAAANMGITTDWSIDSTTTAITLAARLITQWTDATHATRTSQMTFLTEVSGVLTTALILKSGQALLQAGSVTLPSLSAGADPDTGLYFPAANNVAITTGGVARLTIDNAGLSSFIGNALIAQGTITDPAAALSITSTWNDAADTFTAIKLNVTNTASQLVSSVMDLQVGGISVVNIRRDGIISAKDFASLGSTEALRGGFGMSLGSLRLLYWNSTDTAYGTTDVALRRDAAGVLALSNLAVAPQTFRIYETTDAGLTNFSRLSFQTQAGNHLIFTNAAGTGTLRPIQVGTGPRTGADLVGINAIYHSGQSTGTGTGGSILLQVSAPGGAGAGVNALATRLTISSTDITHETAVRFAVTSGTNQRAGNAVLVAGTVTVANTTVTANTIVLLTRKTSGGTIGLAITYTVTAATSFTITSDSAIDTSTFSYFLIEVP